MTNKIRITVLLFLLFAMPVASSGRVSPGFDLDEYIDLIKVTARHYAVPDSSIPPPGYAKFVYRSPIMGLDNRWDLYLRDDKVAIISLRGTTSNTLSWMENLYAAMVPAQGSLRLDNGAPWQYKLAENPRAAVHVGWLIGMAYLSRDILPRIDSMYQNGIKGVVIIGHSQGGAIAFLLTSHLHYLQAQGKLPADMKFKTYCSAGPKPGNLYYAYDYEHITRNGNGYNVVNTADWVPEVPVSVQTVNDMNNTNPFVNAKAEIKKQKAPMRWVLRRMYNRMDRPGRKTQRMYKKYLGNTVAKMVAGSLPEYQPGEYYNSGHYVRTGRTIILYADADYYQKFPDSKTNIFVHHFYGPYLYLAEKLRAQR